MGDNLCWTLLMLLAVGGCPGRDRGGSDSGTDSGIDAGRSDASRTDAATGCDEARPCGRGEECVDGVCLPDLCAEAGLICPTGQTCRTSCVAFEDPCIGVTCGADETCIGGRCVSGCFRNRCEGVTCHPQLRHCDPTTGTCVRTRDCGRACPDGTKCHADCVSADPCADVDCPDGQRCSGGSCVDDPCAVVECTGTEVCVAGECFDSCDCNPGCSAGERCVFGECECAPSCDATMPCGQPDGCGGTCPGECTTDNFVCELNGGRHGCGCVASCWMAGTMCGDPTGCRAGDTCLGACPGGQICTGELTEGRSCECAPECFGKACGAPDGCGGTCDLGECPGGEFCMDGACCQPVCPATSACGDPGGCGVGCIGACPSGQTCERGRDGTFSCACTAMCPAGAACGDPSPCGGGSCNGTCPSGQSCERIGAIYECVCAPDCSGKACGAPDGCGGLCPSGTCPGGEFCMDGFCQPPACDPPCACGEICAGTTCTPLCRGSETLCGCDRCCGGDEECVSGACVPILI